MDKLHAYPPDGWQGMSLLRYWPTAAEVNQCIKPEAEGAHDAVLLAVHQPAPLSYRLVNSDKRTATSEEELLEYFVTANVPTGAHVVPITGASGVGKSHLIRLLDARLRSSADSARYLIIRIPKSASLRRVVELILDPLPNDRYAQVKKAFRNALAEVQVDTAAMRFQIELEIALKSLAKDLKEKLHGSPSNLQLKEQLDHAQKLPLLLSDAATVEHFRSVILPRIVQRAVAGRDAENDDPTQGQFTADDLNLPDGIDLGQAARPVGQYYKLGLQARGGHGREVAAGVLNAVVDQATRQLFQLHEALGGMTLQDVILEVRGLLLKDGRDLVILVEDFAALTGIQETLSKVLIQEGVRDGEKKFATMRSAIAVTDGYLAARDTIATRAMREWIVESRLDTEEEVIDRTKALVASYLNAARWGQSHLINHYEAHYKARTSVKAAVPIFTAEEHDEAAILLSDFGYIGQIPLFPYTELAIECLARAALTKGDTLIFNPRFIINDVLRRILLAGRDAFSAGQFPPPSIEGRGASADVAQWLASLPVSEEQRKRYQRVAVIWGNNPQSHTEIGRIPSGVFKAFSLPPPSIKPIVVVPKSGKGKGRENEKPHVAQEPGPDDVRLRRIAALKEALENWVQDRSQLDQAIAHQIRNLIAVGLEDRIDWNGERCVKLGVRSNQISIPKARGEGGLASVVVKISPDNQDVDGSLRLELISLLRYYHVYEKQINYEEVDDDLARIGNLLDRLLPDALQLVRGAVQQQARAAALALASNSRLLGLNERGRTAGAIWPFLFGEAPIPEKLPDDAALIFQEWRTMQEEARRVRPELTRLLLNTCGCFQGGGKTANGVDIFRVVENYPTDADRLDLAKFELLSPELRQSLTNLSDVRVKAKAKSVLAEVNRLKISLESQFGPSLDKDALANSLKELAEAFRDLGVWIENDIGVTATQFRNLCEEFRSCALKEAFAQIDRTREPDDLENTNKAVSRLAQLSLSPMLTALRLVNSASKVVTNAQRHAQTLEAQYKGVDPVAQANAICKAFDDLLANLATLQQEEK